VFLDDCFASDSAVATLAPYFQLRDFRVIFPDGRKGKQNSILDGPIIAKCHEEKWLLLTTDHEMGKEVSERNDSCHNIQSIVARGIARVASGGRQIKTYSPANVQKAPPPMGCDL
jgi:hypothetical protein